MGLLYAVVIAHYMLHRIRVETQEFNRQYQSDPAMYSNLPAHTVVIANCLLHRILVELLFQLDIGLRATIFYMGILYAVVIEHYMLYRIRVESEEFIHQYESDPAMYSTLPASAVVIAHYIFHRNRVETQEFIREYHSDPAKFSTLPAPAVVIAHCILHRIRRSLHSSCFIEFGLNQKNLSVNMKTILPCTALFLHPQSSSHITYCTEIALKHKSLSV